MLKAKSRESSGGIGRIETYRVLIPAGPVTLDGDLWIPELSQGLALFAHGQGSSRQSPRNILVAEKLNGAGIATLLMDLLTLEESLNDVPLDLGVLAGRVGEVLDWLRTDPRTSALSVGCFGGSTGAAVALLAAAEPGSRIRAVVSRGGRTDLAGSALERVQAPTLLLVGSRDDVVVRLNRRGYDGLGCSKKELAIIPGASHLFEEPGALEEVARRAAEWFRRHLPQAG